MLKKLSVLILVLITLVLSIATKSSYASNDEIVKGKIELVEMKEDQEGFFTAKLKVQLVKGSYTGTSLYMDYTGNLKLREGDEIFVKQVISEGELVQLEFVGFNRSTYLVWMTAVTVIILLTITARETLQRLLPVILIVAAIWLNIFGVLFENIGIYTGAILIISVIFIVTDIAQKGVNKFTLISLISGLIGTLLTIGLQVNFSNAMRLPADDIGLINAGIMIAAAGIIFNNACQLAFEIKEALEKQIDVKREKILSEGIVISRKSSSYGINVLSWAYIGLFFPTIMLSCDFDKSIGIFNNPEFARISLALLSSSIGILIVPIITIIISFLIIDVNNLGRRVPKRKQMEMKV